MVEDDLEMVLGDVSETLLVASGPGIGIPEPQEAAREEERRVTFCPLPLTQGLPEFAGAAVLGRGWYRADVKPDSVLVFDLCAAIGPGGTWVTDPARGHPHPGAPRSLPSRAPRAHPSAPPDTLPLRPALDSLGAPPPLLRGHRLLPPGTWRWPLT